MNAPISMTFYVRCKKDEEGAFEVTFQHEEGYYQDFLREGTMHDLVNHFTHAWEIGLSENSQPSDIGNLEIFTEVNYPLEYPRAAYDCEVPERENSMSKFRPDRVYPKVPARRFALATLAFTPKMAILG